MCRKNCCIRKIRHRTIIFRHLECFWDILTATLISVYFRLKWCRLFHWRASLRCDETVRPRQIYYQQMQHSKAQTPRVRNVVDLLLYNTLCTTTNPQRIKQVEFELNAFRRARLYCLDSNFWKPWPRNFVFTLACRYISRMCSRSSSYVKVIGSKSRSQEQ